MKMHRLKVSAINVSWSNAQPNRWSGLKAIHHAGRECVLPICGRKIPLTFTVGLMSIEEACVLYSNQIGFEFALQEIPVHDCWRTFNEAFSLHGSASTRADLAIWGPNWFVRIDNFFKISPHCRERRPFCHSGKREDVISSRNAAETCYNIKESFPVCLWILWLMLTSFHYTAPLFFLLFRYMRNVEVFLVQKTVLLLPSKGVHGSPYGLATLIKAVMHTNERSWILFYLRTCKAM